MLLAVTPKNSKRFLWPTLASGLLVFDYFLFTTGNPSITYTLFGGWFEVPLIIAAVVTASYGYGAVTAATYRRYLILRVFAVGVFSLALLAASPYAKEFARVRMQAEIERFIKDPINTKADVSDEERQLMIDIRNQKYTMQFEGFIPTFRRMDYLFITTEKGEKYLLVMTMSWSGTPVIWLHRLES